MMKMQTSSSVALQDEMSGMRSELDRLSREKNICSNIVSQMRKDLSIKAHFITIIINNVAIFISIIIITIIIIISLNLCQLL